MPTGWCANCTRAALHFLLEVIAMNRSLLLASLSVGFAVGCGMPMSKTPADPVAYQQLAMDIAGKVEAHRALAADAGTVPSCDSEHTRYDAEVRPMLDQMQSLSTGMDSCMMNMGKAGDADMASTCSSMMSELDRHKTAACGADLVADKAEAVRHCDAMKTWLDTENTRAAYLSGGMGGMGDRCK